MTVATSLRAFLRIVYFGIWAILGWSILGAAFAQGPLGPATTTLHFAMAPVTAPVVKPGEFLRCHWQGRIVPEREEFLETPFYPSFPAHAEAGYYCALCDARGCPEPHPVNVSMEWKYVPPGDCNLDGRTNIHDINCAIWAVAEAAF